MRTGGRTLLVCAALSALAGPAVAQSYRMDMGIHGGGSIWTPFLDGDATGASTVKFGTGALLGAQATLWVTPRIGVRAHLTFEDRAIQSDGLAAVAGEALSLEGMNIWNGTGDLLFRLRTPASEFRGGEFLPYIALGAGMRWINPAGDPYVAVDFQNQENWSGVPFTVTGGNGTRFFMGELENFSVLAGLGSDVRLASAFALRVEVGDRMSKPHVYEVLPTGDPRVYTAQNGRTNLASLAHELYGQAGLHLTLGGAGRAPAPVAVVPAPPPAPPPPAPRAPPREDAVSVCVIDPAAPGGVRTVSALVVAGDTLVVQGANRVAFRTTLPSTPVVGGADWYVAGRPVTLQLRSTASYLATGRGMPVSGLMVAGSVNGLPVYVERSAVSGVASRLEQLNASGPVDLATTLRANADVRSAFESVTRLYVPSSVAGCMFQPLQLQQEVRKSGD